MTTTARSHRRGQVVDDRILQATLDTIAARGTLDIRVDEVADLAGVNKTTIYRRYDDRNELVLAAVLSLAGVTVEIPDTGSVRADLLELAGRVRSTISSPVGRALLSAQAGAGPEFSELRSAFWTQRLDAAAVIVERGAERGECDSPTDPNRLIERVVGPIHFRSNQLGHAVTNEFIAELVDEVLEQYLCPTMGE